MDGIKTILYDGFVNSNKPRGKFVWYAYVRKSRHPGKTEYFSKLLNAAEWVEKELVELANRLEASKEPSHIRTVQQIEADRIKFRKSCLMILIGLILQ